jgi:D-alanyl-D-alanine dipeptidase
MSKHRIVSLCQRTILATICMSSAMAWAANPWAESRQMVVITSSDWGATSGQMQRYVRNSGATAWTADGPASPVVLGKTGMAWGQGLHAPVVDTPQKREGDGKTPAGVFRLPAGFGYADVSDQTARRVKLPYTAATPSVECIDDPNSSSYNRIVDRKNAKTADWSSSETMLRKDELYRWGVVVEHNGQRIPGAGSCVFLHAWRTANRPTVGCSAMSPDVIKDLLLWLDPSKQPILVQLPQAEYAKRKDLWGLP